MQRRRPSGIGNRQRPSSRVACKLPPERSRRGVSCALSCQLVLGAGIQCYELTGGGDVHRVKNVSGSRDETLTCQLISSSCGAECDEPVLYQQIKAWRPNRIGQRALRQGIPESQAQSTMGSVA